MVKQHANATSNNRIFQFQPLSFYLSYVDTIIVQFDIYIYIYLDTSTKFIFQLILLYTHLITHDTCFTRNLTTKIAYEH